MLFWFHYLFFGLEDYIKISFGNGRVLLARPLDADGPEGLERIDEGGLGDVPRHAAQEDLAGQDRVAHVARRKLAGPSTRSIVQSWKV